MVFAMARPTKLPNSRFLYARKVVPVELRAILGRTEFKRPLRAVADADIRRLHRAAMTDFESQIETARAKLSGDLQTLGAEEVSAVVGEWYRAEVTKQSREPGDSRYWEAERDSLLGQLNGEEGGESEPYEPDAKRLAEAEVILASHGIVIAAVETIERTAVSLFSAKVRLAETMIRRASGDFGADHYSIRYADKAAIAPKIVPKPVGMTFAELVKAWAQERKPPLKSREKWDATFAGMAALIGHDDATRVVLADVVAWKKHRFEQGRAAKTVADGVAVMRSTFNWGIKNGHLERNPFAGTSPKFKKHGLASRDGYTDEQAATVLQAARGEAGWLRWLPWLLCFSGGRIEEIAELRRRDIRQEGAVWIIDIKPSETRAGKTDQSQRMVPMHPAVIAEGFLGYVASLPVDGPLWPDLGIGRYGTRGSTATKAHSRWIRGTVGISDKRIAPAHSFRHRLEDSLRKVRAAPEAQDAITGHDNPRNAGAGYGRGYRGMPDEVLKELERVPSPLPPPTSQDAPPKLAANPTRSPLRPRRGGTKDRGGAVKPATAASLP
jgi:integrase